MIYYSRYQCLYEDGTSNEFWHLPATKRNKIITEEVQFCKHHKFLRTLFNQIVPVGFSDIITDDEKCIVRLPLS